jgi:hypothetical protein
MHYLFPRILGLFLTGTLVLIHAAPAQKVNSAKVSREAATKPALDQKMIHAVYTDGDFEGVLSIIESFTAANPLYSKSDSVFIAKHLAVIYTANPATREKGKHYMFRLLELLPSAKIVDMFVSDEIDHIFEKVREEYIVRKESLGEAAPTQLESNQFATDRMTMSATSHREAPAPERKKATHTVAWVVGGTAVLAAAGTLIYFLLPSTDQDKNYDIPR